MTRYYYFFIFSLLIFVFSCKDQSKTTTKTTETKTEFPQKSPQQTPPPPQKKIKVTGEKLYPSVPVDLITSLWNNCSTADFMFNNLPVTMSQQELSDIRHSLKQISDQPAFINKACVEIGRVLFYQKGEIALEGIIHFGEGCTYFIFVENNKPKYANYMTPSGIKFYNDILTKFANMQQQ